MLKKDCETAVRSLVPKWAAEAHLGEPLGGLHFSEFHRWLKANHPQVLGFRSRMPAVDVVEQWFDQETRQTWRN